MARFILLALLFCASLLRAQEQEAPYLLILGTAQDGGFPHFGCTKPPCRAAWKDASKRRFVVSFALVAPATRQWWLFEATPDISAQVQLFRGLTDSLYKVLPDGIFVTHAHIGHYAGLMQLGREVMGAKQVPMYGLPRFCDFLQKNGPWSQLVSLQNILVKPLQADSTLALTDQMQVTAFTVPHRDEYSETAGYRIIAGRRRYLFIPDIDKWEKWSHNIVEEVQQSDVALLDATFFQDGELPNRSMKEVPHPFVAETMKLFENQPESVKNNLYFIHFNHTNPLLWDKKARKTVQKTGFRLAEQGQRL